MLDENNEENPFKEGLSMASLLDRSQINNWGGLFDVLEYFDDSL